MESNKYNNLWPSFIWNLLSDEKVREVYGIKVWKFIPKVWRQWWIDSIRIFVEYTDANIDYPEPYFYDVTRDVCSFKDGIGSKKLGRLYDVCNQYLMPLVLCPWGESEYIHTCGHCYIDVIIQRHLPSCEIKTINDTKSFFRVNSSRDDYLREDTQDYDCLLLNPKWIVRPCIVFVQDRGPLIMTCREHYKGTGKMYIHPPRQPHHILPSKSGDQLCHAIVKSRTIRPMRACKYSNRYQMHEQKG